MKPPQIPPRPRSSLKIGAKLERFGWTVTITCRELERIATTPEEAKVFAWAALSSVLKRAGVDIEHTLRAMPGWVDGGDDR